MYATDSILNFSFSLGTLKGVRVRVSVLLVVAALAVAWRLGDLPLGLLAAAILTLSVLAHQMVQVMVAQASGCQPQDMALWPLGGLSTHGRESSFPVQAQIQFSGLATSLGLAALTAFQLQRMGVDVTLQFLNPFQGFQAPTETDTLALTVWRMICFANVMLASVNLLPIIPFDTGRVLRAFLAERYDVVEVQDVMLRLGLVLSLLGLLTGFVFDQSSVVALASFVLIVHLHEVGIRHTAAHGYFQSEPDDAFEQTDFDESELDEDEFSSSMAQDELSDTDELIARASMMARRRARRESEQQRREAAERQREEEQVDAILERIHRQGRESLNPSELQLLQKVSRRYRRDAEGKHH